MNGIYGRHKRLYLTVFENTGFVYWSSVEEATSLKQCQLPGSVVWEVSLDKSILDG